MKDQKLIIALASDPAEGPLGQAIWCELEKAAAANGTRETFIEAAGGFVCDMLANDPLNVLECVAAVAPGTGDLVLRFGIGDGLGRAIAAAAQDLDFITAHTKLHH